MGGKGLKKVFQLFLLTLFCVCGQDLEPQAKEKIKLCEYCTCSEILGDDGYVVLNVQCSELDKIEALPDLDKIEWPDNPNGLKIAAVFEGLGLSTLGKLPPNTQVASLRFNNNAIKTYWPDPFKDVPNLKKLSFTTNDLTEITPDLFTNIERLEDLDLSYNKLSEFNPLDFNNLSRLKRLNLQSNSLKKVPIDALQPLSSLEELDLSRNGIFDLLLDRSNSDTLKGVKRLNLAGNRIRSVMKDSFPENNSLELLDLSTNIIEIIEENTFISCPNLRELNLGQNKITFIFALPPSLQIAILKQNTLHRWPKFPSNITYIDLSFNRLTDLYDGKATEFENLEILNIAGNQLKELNLETKLPKLYSLDISYNQFEEVPSSLNTITFPNLEELRLDGNPIKSIYFKKILNVRNLYMNELSALTEVEDKAFSNVMGKSEEGCFSLHLSNCHSLSEVSEGAFAGTSLCMLDLSNNNLTHLSERLLDWGSVRSGVDLQGNPWHCACELQWVLTTLLPSMYERHSRLLTQLRCGSPRAVQGLRLVHWYNWSEPVLCRDYLNADYRDRGSYLLESSEGPLSLSRVTSTTLILGASIIIGIFIAIGLIVYLVKTRRQYQVRKAAMKRKRQSAADARNSGIQKEQYSALNKV